MVTRVVTGSGECLWLNEWVVRDIGSGGCVTEVLHSVFVYVREGGMCIEKTTINNN